LFCKWPVCMLSNWYFIDLAFCNILQMYGMHFKQPMFYIFDWVLALYHIFVNG
jgi:hypothetical protein